MGGKSKAFFKSKRGWGEEEMGRRGEEGKRRWGEEGKRGRGEEERMRG
jgi:hypothetical protein